MFFAAFCGASLCFSLVRVDYRVGAACFLIGSAVVAAVVKDRRIVRWTIYGGVIGILSLFSALLLLAFVRDEWPFIASYTVPHTSLHLARRFAIPIGGGIGVFFGILLAQYRDSGH